MDFFDVLTMVGGLALFLYGMNLLGDGLAKASGGRLESILEKLTNNPLKVYGLKGFNLEIVERVPIEMEPGKYDMFYLKTY